MEVKIFGRSTFSGEGGGGKKVLGFDFFLGVGVSKYLGVTIS